MIPMYDTIPKGKISLDNLEELVNKRMELLYALDDINHSKGTYKADPIKSLIQKMESTIGWENDLTKEQDNISHFILCVAFCKSDSSRMWFANLESRLMRERIEYDLSNIALLEVFKSMRIPLEICTNIDNSLKAKIQFKSPPGEDKSSNDFYKIPFEYVLNLLPTMNYFINKGFVYISCNERLPIVINVFKDNLLKKLNKLNKYIDMILNDNRISKLVGSIEARRDLQAAARIIDSSMSESEYISLNDIENHSEKFYPLCMQILHRNLTKDSHLRHTGRLQYGLFLKGIGLSLEESLTFWKRKFSSKIPEDKFDKEYSYNVRHSYGKEGKRANYPPWSCGKIQNLSPPSNVEYHGCPFKVFSDEKLKMLLHEMRFTELDVGKIMEKKKNNEYSYACVKHFEARFPEKTYDKVGIHPNGYYESAVKGLKKKIKVRYEESSTNESSKQQGNEMDIC